MWCAAYGLGVDLCVTMCMFIKCGESGAMQGEAELACRGWGAGLGGSWEGSSGASQEMRREAGRYKRVAGSV